MHEMAIARSLVEIVEEHARREDARRVTEVRVSVGALSHVDARALEFGFEAATRQTVAEGARLVVLRPAGKAWCTDCSDVVDIAAYGAPCPRCGGHRWLVQGGDELKIVDMEVE